MDSIFITIPIAASTLISGIKWFFRQLDPNFEFSMNFYKFMLPVSQVIVAPILLVAGFITELPEYLDFTSYEGWIRTIIWATISSAISVFYHGNVVEKWNTASGVKELNNNTDNLSDDFENVVEDLEDRVGDI